MSKWYSLGTKLNEKEHKEFLDFLSVYNEIKNTSYTPNKFLHNLVLTYIRKNKSLVLSMNTDSTKQLT